MHVTGFLTLFILADIMFCSYISVDTLSGDVRYALDPFPSDDSDMDEIITDIFSRQASDVLRYNASCEILGISGSGRNLNVNKMVDLSDYYHGVNSVSVKYSLSDLINLGRRGIIYNERNVSINDFVYYFGDPISAQNFALDEYGNLYFKGFMSVNKTQTSDPYSLLPEDVIIGEGEETVKSAMSDHDLADLLHMVVEYCIREYPEYVRLSYWEDGIVNVSFKEPMQIAPRPGNPNGIKYPAGNWDEYFIFIDELKTASEMYSEAYEVYRRGYSIYDEKPINLLYAIRTRDSRGRTRVYTNNSESLQYDDTALTEHYSDHSYYLICYYDDLEYSTLTDIPESVLTDVIRSYPDIYPDYTRVWMCLDNTCSVGEDIYYDLIYSYNDVKQLARFFTIVITLLVIVWLVIFAYLTFVTGVNETDGSDEFRIFPQDRIWLEFIVLLALAASVVGRFFLTYLLRLVDENYCHVSAADGGPFRNAGIWAYLAFGLFGLYLSILLSFFFFTIVRRIRSGVLYEYSLAKRIKQLFDWFALTLSGGAGATATVLIPYILFLMLNCIGVPLALYMLNVSKPVSILMIAIITVVDIFVGITLFLITAEKKKLLDGIARIRSGDADYKIDAADLRAENRNLAESINNIGEGIKNALEASITEEQLRTELITNVSHDLKTPITSIINYSELLKRDNVDEEKKKEYLSIISDKSKKLKKLLEDLLEASRLSSGKVDLRFRQTDVSELLNQAIGEYKDRFEANNLEIICSDFPRTFIYADAGCMWRVFDNLFGNICKYALEGTRIYVNFSSSLGMCVISIKNVSAVKPRYQGNELTERFIRGDESRSGDGSGLGLFIAKNLTEANGGTFDVVVDGDTFTTVIRIPEFSFDLIP